ncbi:MAG: ribbon-helix-helix protein, CopG family [Lachnospiraceae bacterium]|nr:ribbon-helix-helix protein, CopG family [Lachnospiraceae bacterium]
MPRTKKDNVPVSFRLAKEVNERLEQFCKDSGQSKTVAVERAIIMYIDDYEAKQKKLNEVQ